MKRVFALLLLFLFACAGATAIYLFATTPSKPRGVQSPLNGSQQRLLGAVPPDAEMYALIPSAAAVYKELEANPITRDTVREFAKSRRLPKPWMLGAGDLVLWRANGQTGVAVRLDPVRAFLARISGANVTILGDDAPAAAEPAELRLLPPGDALVEQRTSSRGAFPPIGRPAVSTVRIDAGEITIVSRAPGEPGKNSVAPAKPQLPTDALMGVWFSEAPRVLNDLDRILLARLSPLIRGGGSLILYDVNAGTLLPRPRGLLVVPENDDTRAAADGVRSAAELIGEVRTANGRIHISFDDASLGRYEAGNAVQLPFEATDWAVRIDVQRLLPILHRLGDNTGLRLASPRIYRSARDLRRWIDVLAPARTIEAALAREGDSEVLRVRVESK